ncbi:glycoside hydrolase family 16 protein [Flavicella sp.]|uniref:glycoside hydrolase family 16 protein n=1 Tax=Flavicella sp. TaxID=2957742 RepID=UPI002602F14A|nr:glycoside hydrolase family 16 protein [Flavicella sp.]MDG1806106.1 glycoside hydrolase family 16 protein [Flavicella sp.]
MKNIILKTCLFSILVSTNVSCQVSTQEFTAVEIPVSETVIKSAVPKNYNIILKDDFTFFDTANWSKGLTHDMDPSIKMIWNKETGGEHLLNNNYAGYVLDNNTFIANEALHLENKKETIKGTDPSRDFGYSTGWINSLQKINFNGTENGIYLKIKAKFPKGDKVWPAIWLIDDSPKRSWPPEIDIWEYFGKFFNTKKTDEMYMRYIYGHWSNKEDHSIPIQHFHTDYNASEKWHIYGFQWTSKEMNWFIDGEKVHTKTKGKDIAKEDWPDKQMCLVINNGLLEVVPEGNTQFPNALVLDFLELYEEN